ncbi:hypothetical protein ACLOAV_000826 [Pseudogymnoascus australis]
MPQPTLACQSRRRKKAKTSDEWDIVCEDDQATNHDLVPSPESDTHRRYPNTMHSVTYPQGVRRAESIAMMQSLGPELSNMREIAPASPVLTAASSTPRSDILSMHNLSFIIHPSHEASNKNGSPEAGSTRNGFSETDGDTCADQILMERASYALNTPLMKIQSLIKLYFANMTSFSLFRQPTFDAKLRAITSSAELNALLAAMFAYSVRFEAQGTETCAQGNFSDHPNTTMNERFLDMALSFIDQALIECADETPSLNLLQAMILTTFQQLICGVRGRAWRALGRCVRIAYELYLHLIDTNKGNQDAHCLEADAEKWSNNEERRRAWWAIWEMDVFASTIRRCPTSIDWTQIEVYLPSEDIAWFQGKVQRSCFLERMPIDRWGALQNTNNQAPKAWFIVVNSLMREAQVLSNPRGVLHLDGQSSNTWTSMPNNAPDSDKFKAISERLVVLENSLRCFTMALPSDLKYRDEYLTFSSPDPESVVAVRQRHSARYAIHMMTQLTKFMIHHYTVFESPASRDHPNEDKLQNPEDTQKLPMLDRQALKRCMEAAESIVILINRSADSHIKHVNPFVASTVWLAAAIQLVFGAFCPFGTSKSLVHSNFKVLRLNYSQFIDHWKTSMALQMNLDLLDAQLRHLGEPKTAERPQQSSSMRDLAESRNVCQYPNEQPSRTVEEEGAVALQSLGEEWLYQNQNQPKHLSAYMQQTNATLSELDGVYGPSMSSGAVIDSTGFGFDFGGNGDLPYYLNGLLSGSFIE